jgi:steroid delta-isomerase-like uncharacterized protein
MSEENKAIVRGFGEQVWNEGQLDRFEEFIARDVVPHTGPGVTDANSLKQGIARIRNAFPDIHIALDAALAEEDKVVARFTISGTHKEDFNGIPATGKQAVWSGITIYRLAGGKIVEFWTEVDTLGMMQQLGVIPAPGAGGD